jgi:hypothetical protein
LKVVPLSSINLAPIEPLPPPLPNLLSTQIEDAVLAYRKRGRSLEQGSQTLRALGILERPIEMLLVSVRYYGANALTCAQTIQKSATALDAAAAAFIVAAVEQAMPSATVWSANCWRDSYSHHPRAVRDALWFYGAPELCDELLASTNTELKQLGIELTGRMTQQRLAPVIETIDMAPEFEPVRQQVLGLLDAVKRAVPPNVSHWLEADVPQWQRFALNFLLVTGIPVSQSALQAALKVAQHSAAKDSASGQNNLDAVCALSCIHCGGANLNLLDTASAVPHDTGVRCAALLGTPGLLLKALSKIDGQDEPLTQVQKDLLLMTLGELPAELLLQPGSRVGRSRAVRELAAKVFRRNGCTDIMPDQFEGWSQDLLKKSLWPLEQIRLRAGRPWNKKFDGELMCEVSHDMRRWLYAEYAALTQRAFPLMVDDRASRQLEVLQTLAELNDLFDLQ